jgi:hypothetical protein
MKKYKKNKILSVIKNIAIILGVTGGILFLLQLLLDFALSGM